MLLLKRELESHSQAGSSAIFHPLQIKVTPRRHLPSLPAFSFGGKHNSGTVSCILEGGGEQKWKKFQIMEQVNYDGVPKI